ncbi:DNA polymerase III subunit gamma/tau [Flavobacterium sp.]|uniref:DNA polymerase III subunit gamma/tau n=1 Tax=Flavobacterium sp. TaxID=239 RepID=UPI0037BF041A
MKSIKQIEIQQKAKEEEIGEHPTDEFSQEDLELHWNNYVNYLNQKGKKILMSYMTLSKPIKMGNHILLEFPNQGSKEDFESKYAEVLSYLKTKLRNFDIKIKITVIETYKPKVHYTNEDKFNHFKEINPVIEQFRTIFELDI